MRLPPGLGARPRVRPGLDEELALIRKEIPFFTDKDRAKILGTNAAKLWGFGEARKE